MSQVKKDDFRTIYWVARVFLAVFAFHLSPLEHNNILVGKLYPAALLASYGYYVLYPRYLDTIAFVELGVYYYGAQTIMGKSVFLLESLANVFDYPLVAVRDYTRFGEKLAAYATWREVLVERLGVDGGTLRAIVRAAACSCLALAAADVYYLIMIIVSWDMLNDTFLLIFRVIGPDVATCCFLLEVYAATVALRALNSRLAAKRFNGDDSLRETTFVFELWVPGWRHDEDNYAKNSTPMSVDELIDAYDAIETNLRNTSERFRLNFVITFLRCFASFLLIPNILLLSTITDSSYELNTQNVLFLTSMGAKFLLLTFLLAFFGEQVRKEATHAKQLCTKLILADECKNIKRALCKYLQVLHKKDLRVRFVGGVTLDYNYISFIISTVIMYIIINFQAILSEFNEKLS